MSLALPTAVGLAACRGDGTHYPSLINYEGTIADKYQIRATLVIGDETVKGVYFYVSQLRDIKLVGSTTHTEDGTKIVLDERESNGRVAARFEGQFLQHGAYRCEEIYGHWSKADSNERLPFKLSMVSVTGGTLEHRYGSGDDELIHRNARRFWEAVKRNDKRTVVSLISYPVRVRRHPGAPKPIRNSKELLSNYDVIFYPAYRERIANAVPRHMFVNYQGVMLGRGEVWFGDNGKVITLNN